MQVPRGRVTSPNFPAGQSVHAAAPPAAGANLPWEQVEHSSTDAALHLPVGQSVHCDLLYRSEVRAYWPGAQPVQTLLVAPTAALTRPAAQTLQEDAPASPHLPTGHVTHVAHRQLALELQDPVAVAMLAYADPVVRFQQYAG